MLSEQDKKIIYEQLTGSKKFDLNVSYPLSKVGKELTLQGFGCRRFGYTRIKDVMEEMKGYIRMEEVDRDGHSNCNIVILPLPGTESVKSSQEETDHLFSDALEESENEMVSFSMPAQEEPESEPFTNEIKEEFYRLLLSQCIWPLSANV